MVVTLMICSFSYSCCAVDGILLTKAGTMTGGTCGGVDARSHKWDHNKIKEKYGGEPFKIGDGIQ
ncbi:hypothetical protein Hdeb2414_s0074g00775111 [Helianthus debilis subsp. tardiflorus]